MKNYFFILSAFFIFSCTGNESKNINEAIIENETDTASKFGEWEQHSNGSKYREDHKLRDFIAGNELVKYTRTDDESEDNSTKTKFTLCRDGSMKYYHRSRNSGTGTAAKDATQEEDNGTWRAVENSNGQKIILLISDKDKSTRLLEVKVVGGTEIRLLWFDEWHEFLVKKIDC